MTLMTTLLVNMTKAGYVLKFDYASDLLRCRILWPDKQRVSEVCVLAASASDDLLATEIEVCMIKAGALTLEQLRA